MVWGLPGWDGPRLRGHVVSSLTDESELQAQTRGVFESAGTQQSCNRIARRWKPIRLAMLDLPGKDKGRLRFPLGCVGRKWIG